MTKRMTTKLFISLPPEDIEKMTRLDISVNRFNLKMKSRLKRRSKKIKSSPTKSNKQRYGSELGSIIDWLDENCSSPYYAKFADEDAHSTKKDKIVAVYFIEESDAMAVKLMFG